MRSQELECVDDRSLPRGEDGGNRLRLPLGLLLLAIHCPHALHPSPVPSLLSACPLLPSYCMFHCFGHTGPGASSTSQQAPPLAAHQASE